jgi:hypothetical protein
MGCYRCEQFECACHIHAQVSAFKSWLDEKEAAQSKKQDHEDPAFLADEVRLVSQWCKV